jgi:hypothetical protein
VTAVPGVPGRLRRCRQDALLRPRADDEQRSSVARRMPPGFEAGSARVSRHLVAPVRGQAMSLPGAESPVQREWRHRGHPTGHGRSPAAGHPSCNFCVSSRSSSTRSAVPREPRLYAELETIALPLVGGRGKLRRGRSQPARSARLRRCCSSAMAPPGPEMPVSWPALDAGAVSRLGRALGAWRTLQDRAETPGASPGRRPLSDPHSALSECGCPARTVWSDYSEPSPSRLGTKAPAPRRCRSSRTRHCNLLKS